MLVAQLCPTLCDPMDPIVSQASLSVGFSTQEYWTGLPFPSPEKCPNTGMKLGSPALQADSLPSQPPAEPKAIKHSPAGTSLMVLRLLAPNMEDPDLIPGQGARPHMPKLEFTCLA